MIKGYFKKIAERKAIFILLLFCGVAFLTSAVFLFLEKRLQSAALSLLFFLMLLCLVPTERALRLRIPALGYALILSLMLGALLGGCYNFYFLIPFWDAWLHGLSGLLFACIGYSICKLLFPKEERPTILPYLFVGVMFSLSVALLWELFEAGATYFFAVDMQEDTMRTAFKSFYLSGTHNRVFLVENIRETVIYYGDGSILRLSGYLDLGLADTLGDMAVCLIGNLCFLLLFPLDKLLHGRILSALLPTILTRDRA